MARKKKLNKKLKACNIVLICLLVVFILALTATLITMMFNNKTFYKLESREEQIATNKKKDNESYKTIGWVRVQGTNIDYPLYGVTPSSEEYPVNESLLWDLNMDGKSHPINMVYGHNVTNLSSNPKRHDKSFTRLEEMMSYVYYDFAKENKYFQISINGEESLYKIFAVDFLELDQINEFVNIDYTKQEKKDYIKMMKNNSLYDFDVDVTEDDDLGSVITCTRFFGNESYDFAITGRKVRADEKIENYDVLRTKKYVEVSDRMKGDDNNE